MEVVIDTKAVTASDDDELTEGGQGDVVSATKFHELKTQEHQSMSRSANDK